jgi:hypothetical protein
VMSINERRLIFSSTNRLIFRKNTAPRRRSKFPPGVAAQVVLLETLLKMKRDAGRVQDLIDIEALQRIR